MELFFRIALFIASIINLLPAIMAFLPNKMVDAYGIPLPEGNLALLMRHRAVLFGIVGGLMLYSAITKRQYDMATIVGLISMSSFILLYYTVGGDIGKELTKVMKIDAIVVLALLLTYILFKLNK